MIKQFFRDLRKYFRLVKFKDKWRKLNPHNKTIANSLFPIQKVKVGKFTYGILNVHYYKNNNEFLNIGCFCSIADDVHFFTGGNHEYKNIMTYPFKSSLNKRRIFKENTVHEALTKGPIIVEDDVWIGYGSIILSGVHIGKGAVIGAGSIVSKDIPPYAIYVRNRVIKYRFKQEIVDKLLKIDFSKIKDENLKSKIDILYTQCTEENIDEIISEVME